MFFFLLLLLLHHLLLLLLLGSKGVCALSAGTPEEMVCPGGELAFVTQMVKDSLKLQGRVHWYTSMVGKKTTLKQLRRKLHESKVTALRTTEFVQVRLADQSCRQMATGNLCEGPHEVFMQKHC